MIKVADGADRPVESLPPDPMSRAVLASLTHPGIGGESSETFRFVDVDAPQLLTRDLGVTRGDGVFETIGVVQGRPQALDAHLRRFATSAAALDLPSPDDRAWRITIAAVCERLADVREVSVKIVLTRGVEGSGTPTGWAYGVPSPDFASVRRDGLSVTLLDRGYRHDVARTSPWLLQGAKTLSYAVNTATLREAARRDADDVIFTSSDGIVLEGPTSSVVYLSDGALSTPDWTALPILAGTTQTSAFEFADKRGIPTARRVPPVSELIAAEAVWLLSSVRLATPVYAIDGTRMNVDAGLTGALNEFLLARTG